MLRKHPVLFGVVITGCLAACGLAVIAHANDDETPSTRQIAFAKDVSDLLVNEVVAALFKEFDETTTENVEHGKQAISLIFNDVNRNIRLIGAFGPLLGGSNDRPSDRFESTALSRALTGQDLIAVQQVNDTWYYRRTVPLRNTLHPIACSVTRTSRPTSSTARTLISGSAPSSSACRFDRPTGIISAPSAWRLDFR